MPPYVVPLSAGKVIVWTDAPVVVKVRTDPSTVPSVSSPASTVPTTLNQ